MPEPTKKSPEIDSLLKVITSRNRVDTIKADMCMTCDGSATEFKDNLSRREYRISGMCQTCQDSIFGGG